MSDFTNGITVLSEYDATTLLQKKSLRSIFSLRVGDVLAFEVKPRIALKTQFEGHNIEMLFIEASLNGKLVWLPLAQILGLKALPEHTADYASSSLVNFEIANCFDLDEVRSCLAHFGMLEVVEMRPFTATFPVFEAGCPTGQTVSRQKQFPVFKAR